jgi:Zn finger protein HypA/HybF involved in hydrogenase expression
MSEPPIIVQTLGDYRKHGYSIYAWCWQCETSREAPLGRLIEKHGEDHPVAQGLALKCGVCGGKRVDISVSSPRADY